MNIGIFVVNIDIRFGMRMISKSWSNDSVSIQMYWDHKHFRNECY